MRTDNFAIVHLLLAAETALEQGGFSAVGFRESPVDSSLVTLYAYPNSGLDAPGRGIRIFFNWNADESDFWTITCRYGERTAATTCHRTFLPQEVQTIVTQVLKG